ncbi:RsmD family RNA methyltransferase [Alkalihalobacillus sp. MEB130]|uniref:TRM11 family SAM-dependent methyltransferase n=1 Tax=Alkalihalobacillus sp. MEB130 TaxID=2976704 RepID=UPI0028DE7B65|nr:RNA methyltransferase [Alkalihalobacillus sp. MEB130]MDT8861020.1 RsmD family RNA methyltransferase [Alkalihalobacillus sp. MEB130]
MTLHRQEQSTYLYMYSYREDERLLCKLEMRAFFGRDTDSFIIESHEKINPSRSPFMKARLDKIYENQTLEGLTKQAEALQMQGKTFKVLFVKQTNQRNEEQVEFSKRREIERKVGSVIQGVVDLHNPELLLGIIKVKDKWILGIYHKSKAIWLQHQSKPAQYSTALSTRVARAIVNIAAPYPSGVKLIDPCCGIGTVLVEALSMGINIVGRDLNPLVIPGARENIAFFGLEGEVTLGDVREVSGDYDVAIIDMPYNLCSVITSQEKLEMIQNARRFSKKLVVVTIEPMDSVIMASGFEIVDRCVAKKGTFLREVLVCV